jgi:hypothetical protein
MLSLVLVLVRGIVRSRPALGGYIPFSNVPCDRFILILQGKRPLPSTSPQTQLASTILPSERPRLRGATRPTGWVR